MGDQHYIDQFKIGFPIVGEILKSHVWDEVHEEINMTVDQLDEQAWDIRIMIINRIKNKANKEHCKNVWDSSIDEIDKGFMYRTFL